MKPVTILTDEHKVIQQALKAFSHALEKLQKGDNPPREFFDCLLKFLDTFVEKYHAFKEEDMMFELIAQKRDMKLIEQIQSLRYHHERCRHHITEMSKSLDGYEKEDPTQTTRLVEHLAAYTSLLKLHLHWEDNYFYPLAAEAISPAEEESLLKQFDKENKKFGNMLERCNQLLNSMESLL